ncbi:MAG: amino acid-binding protein [Clostridia bacterium]|nr:amino acid-binding protein [Clostridia bacterium]
MLINQIAVFLENREGRIRDLSKVLAKAGVNILAMYVADTEEFGILRAITDDNTKAVAVLKENGFNTAVTDLIGFQVDDKSGELYKVLEILGDAGININYLYSFTRSSRKSAVILIKVDDNNKTAKVLRKHGIDLVDEGLI